MAKVEFFTAVSFVEKPTFPRKLLETVDSYFYLGGKKAYVLQNKIQNREETILQDDPAPYLITAIKVISYFSLVLPVIMLIAKIVLRSIYTFTYSIPSAQQSQLEEGINITPSTIRKIQRLMPKILWNKEDAEIRWHEGINLTFSLASVPHLIFKMTDPHRDDPAQRSDARFANMLKAQEVCRTHQLGLLVIPHAKKFIVEGHRIIAEERLDICHNNSAQEELYRTSISDEAVRQLALFIAKTGCSDVVWHNMPIMQETTDRAAPRKVALIDLEEMESALTGIFGDDLFRRHGLIQCLHSERQMDIALAEAARHGVEDHAEAEQAKAKRMKEIQRDDQLRQFYMKNGVSENPRKPVQVDDLTSLGLNLDEEELTEQQTAVTLRQATEYVIEQINKAINDTPEEASTKGKRSISLNHRKNEILQNYHSLPTHISFHTEAERNQRWLVKIINALVAKGHLFKLDEINCYGYYLQA